MVVTREGSTPRTGEGRRREASSRTFISQIREEVGGRDHHATRHCARVSPGCCALSLYCILDLSMVTYWLSVSRWPYFSLRWKKRSEYSLLDTYTRSIGWQPLDMHTKKNRM